MYYRETFKIKYISESHLLLKDLLFGIPQVTVKSPFHRRQSSEKIDEMWQSSIQAPAPLI